MTKPRELVTPHGIVPLPAFFPDATHGAVRATGFEDVAAAGLPGVVMNSYHLSLKPGAKLVKYMGGLHAFTGWQGIILTDSGGFQLFSLIRENGEYGEIRDNEIIFRPERGDKKLIYTPEKCIQAQFMFKSDIMMALDVCTHPDDPAGVQERAVTLTARWAERCRREYDTRIAAYKNAPRPLLFGIVQGGGDPALRAECGRRLRDLDFDGYAFGGWPLDSAGKIRLDILKMAADAMPDDKPKYAMGLGKPEEIARCADMGYSLFDCVIPTREARHHRLYAFRPGMATREGARAPDGNFYRHIYILDEKYRSEDSPLDAGCNCALCANHPAAYLRHLFKINDSQAMRLATAHNLRFYGRLMELLRLQGKAEDKPNDERKIQHN